MLQFIIVAGTLVGLYRQLRLQSSTSATEQLHSWDAEWMSERNTRYRLDILVALRDGTDPAHVPSGAAAPLMSYWERVAILARGRHIDRELLWNFVGAECVTWWSTLAPFTRRVRTESGDPLIAEHFEWLAGVLTEQDRKAGLRIPDDKPTLAGWLNGIAIAEHQLLVEQALRSVVIASPAAVTVAQPAPTAPLTAPAQPAQS
jgi:hypothetical protein